MKARDAGHTAETQEQIERFRRLGWYHSIELPSGEVIQGHQSLEHQRLRLRQFPIPENLRGKRVLDIGAWDGWFSFEMEKRGASVVAVDATYNEKLLQARDWLGSKIEYRVADVCDLRAADVGTFDIVLFLGVLYHLKHPLLAIERVCALSRDLVCVESQVMHDGFDPASVPVMEFYETNELGGQFDNWVGPNVACLMAMCRSAGFARVRFEGMLDDRAHVSCFRKWDSLAGAAPAPYIASIANTARLDLSFSATKDEYVSAWFSIAASGVDGGRRVSGNRRLWFPSAKSGKRRAGRVGGGVQASARLRARMAAGQTARARQRLEQHCHAGSGCERSAAPRADGGHGRSRS